MGRFVFCHAAMALFITLLMSVPVQAQATRTWVSGVGDDANPCSRTAPCKTFAGAISKTAASGEINCLDPGGFGALTITKAITISCEAGTAGVLVSGTNGINIAAGASDVVVLRGLDFEGLGQGLSGISFTSGSFLHIDDCRIRNFLNAGIAIAPNQTAKFLITDSQVIHTGGGAGETAGILIRPTAGSTQGIINHTIVDRGNFGITLDAQGGVVGMNVAIENVTIANHINDGLTVTAGSPVDLSVKDSLVSQNGGNGINNAGPAAAIFVAGSAITGNGVGIAGTVQSFLNNVLIVNQTNGTMVAAPGGLK